MPRNSEDLSRDYFYDENVEVPGEKKKLSKKKKNYIVGLSITGVIVIAVALLYYFAATVWLADYVTLGYLTYAYSVDSNEASVVRINLDSDYPSNFRIPAKVKGRAITKIEDGAFQDAENLVTVTMTDNITYIGEGAFRGCYNLANFNFSSNLEFIGTDAFEDTAYFDNLPDDDLTFVDDILLKVGVNYFDPNSILVNDIDSYNALDDKYKSYNVYYWSDMPEARMWMNGLFANNENLVYVEMPQYFDEIPANSFQNCYNLLGVDFPDNVSKIGDYCFAGCSNLVDGNLPNTLTSIGAYAFQDTSTVIPSDLSHCTQISEGAFQNCKGVTEIIYPALSSISNYCFDGCSNLTKFTFSDRDSVSLIGTAAFRGTGIDKFEVPEHVNVIRDYTFANCPNLTTLYLYNNTTGTGVTTESTFTYTEIDEETGEEVEVEETTYSFSLDGIDSINAYAFYNSSNFDTINLYDIDGNYVYEEHVMNMPVTLIRTSSANGSTSGYSFNGSGAKVVNFNYGITTIGAFLFRNVTSLTKVTFAQNTDPEASEAELDSLTSIGERAFEGCSNLAEFYFPSTLTTINSTAFSGCSSLNNANLGNTSVSSIPIDCFSGCSSIQEASIGLAVTRIYTGAYNGVVSLNEILIPANVNTVEAGAFANETDNEHTSNLTIYLERTQSNYESTSSRYFASGWFDDTCDVYLLSEEEPEESATPTEGCAGYWHYDSYGNPAKW